MGWTRDLTNFGCHAEDGGGQAGLTKMFVPPEFSPFLDTETELTEPKDILTMNYFFLRTYPSIVATTTGKSNQARVAAANLFRS